MISNSYQNINAKVLIKLSKNTCVCIGRVDAHTEVPFRKVKLIEKLLSQKLVSSNLNGSTQSGKTSKQTRIFSSLQDASDLKTESPSQSVEKIEVEFILKRKCSFGQTFHVTGNGVSLGKWNLEEAVPLIWHEGDYWTATVKMPAGCIKEFKYILKTPSGKVTWQPGMNRVLEVPRGVKGLIVVFPWGDELDDDVHPEILMIPIDSTTVDKTNFDNVEGNVSNGSPRTDSTASGDVSIAEKSSNGASNGAATVVEKTDVVDFEEKAEQADNNGSFVSSVVSGEFENAKEIKTETRKKKGNGMFDRDVKWIKWSWTTLLSSLGRKSLMEEEKKEES